MNPRQTLHRLASLTPIAATLSLLVPAHGATENWTGATGGTWGTNTNWSDSVTPDSTYDLTILGPGNVAGALNINVAAAAAANSINFTNTAATTLTNTTSGANQTLTLGSGGLTTGTGAVTIGSATANQNINVALGGSQAWSVGAGNMTVNNVISGTGFALTKNGAGRLSLLGANTFSGGMNVNAGIVEIQNNAALGTGQVTLAGGTAQSAGSNVTISNNITAQASTTSTLNSTNTNFTISGNVSGSGAINRGTTNTSSLYLAGDNSGYTGTFTQPGNGNAIIRFQNANAGSANASWVFNNTVGGRTSLEWTANSGVGTISFGSLTGGGQIQNNTSGTKTISAGALGSNDTFSGNLAANGGNILALTKVGSGTLTLSGASNYTGATTISGGTLQIGAGGTTGSITSASIVNDATLAFNRSDAVTYSGVISGTGAVNKLGAGMLTLSGFSSYTGTTAVSAGTLKVTGAIDLSALSLGAATLSGNGFVGPVTVNNTSAVIANGNANTDTLSLNALAFTTTGTANLNLSSGFSSAIVVTDNLNVGPGFTVNVSSVSPWISGMTYDLITYGTLTGSPANITKGTIPGLGGRQSATLGNSGSAITLTISGDTPVWTGVQSNAWTTAVIPGSKNWKLQNAGTPTDFLSNDQVLFDDSATGTTDINISTANVPVASVVFNNAGVANFGLDYTIFSSGGFGIADGAGAATLTKNGTGTVTLKTINSYTGATTINDGTLQLGDGSTDGNIASGSAISVDSFGTLVFNRVGSFTNGNVISGSGAIVKNGAGTQILTGDNTMSGVTTINAGVLQVGDGGTTGTLGTSPVVNDASLVFNRSSAFTVSGAISGSGSVSQTGTGAVTLSGNSSYSGGTTISPGSTILVGGNSALGTGTVTLADNVVLGAAAGNGAQPNAIVAPAATTATLATNGANLTLNGNITGSGNLNRTATGAAATVFLGGDNSGYTGTFTIENNGNAATRFNATTAGSANARWVNNNPTSGRVTVESAGGTLQFGSLTGTGTLSAQFAANTIEVGALGLSETYSGVLNQVGTGVLAVTKVGSGTWTLTGTNAYTGDTTVNNGVLAVDGDAIPNAGKLIISGGKVDPTGVEVVDKLFFGAAQQAAGTWGSTASAATNKDDTRFSGTGVVSVTTGPVAGYSAWADANAPGQTMDQDHDNDGVKNGIEYFMGLSGSAFTANPAPISGTVIWPMGATYAGVYGTDYQVQTSTDLATWTQVPVGSGDNTVTVTAGTSVVYDMPTGGKRFVRLVVTN